MNNFSRIPFSDWIKGAYNRVAIIKPSFSDISCIQQFAPAQLEEDGLGAGQELLFRHQSGIQLVLVNRYFPTGPNLTTIDMVPTDPMTPIVLDEFLAWLGIGAADLTWLAPVITLPTYRLWRQDDNGQTFHIETVSGLGEAIRRVKAFEALGHKQCYWYEQA